jgi:hypothetical protein
VFPGSVESGALLLPKLMVPPLVVDGLTTLVTAALNPVTPGLDVGLVLLLLPPLLHAASAIAAAAPNAARPKVLRLLMG